YLYSRMIPTKGFCGIQYSNLVVGGCIFITLMLLALATVYPPADITHHVGNGKQTVDPFHFGLQFLRAMVSAFFPIHFSFPATFAFPGELYENGLRVRAALLLLALILVSLWNVFRLVPMFFLVVTATALAAGAFSSLVYPGAVRHFGVVFIS